MNHRYPLPPEGIRQLLSSSGLAAIHYDRQLQVVWATEGASNAWGPLDHRRRERQPAVSHGLDGSGLNEVLQSVLANGQPREMLLHGPEGQQLLGRVSPWEDGRDGVLVTLTELAPTVVGRAAFHERGDAWQEVFRASSNGVLTLDEQGLIVDLNPAAERLLGVEAVDVVGREPEEATLGGGSHWAFCRSICSYVRGEHWTSPDRPRNVKGKRRNGDSFYCELVATVVEKPGGRQFVFLMGDITRTVRAEREAAARRRLFEATVGNAAVGISVCNMNNEWLFVNDQLCAMLGYTRRELVDLNPRQITHPEDQAASSQAFREMLEKREHRYQMQKRFICRDGSTLWALITVSLQKDQYGQPLRSIMITQDISEVKKLEQELRQSIRDREQFLAMLSHELRNPLSAMLNASRVLETTPGDLATLQEAAEVVRSNARAMGGMLEDLLDISRFSSSKIRLQRQDLDLVPLVAEAAESVRHLMEARNQRFELVLAETGCLVNGDPGRLQQAVVNLLVNASKYTPVGGQIGCRLESKGEHVELKVSDSGAGIPVELLEKVFEPFYQGQQTIDRSHGGMGLGLPLVRMIVRLHGGEVAAHSNGPGTGSLFRIALPLCEPTRPSELPLQLLVPEGGWNVMVVDDHAGIRMMLGRVLELKGMAVRLASDGRSAMQLLQQSIPDVMLIDIGLPDLNGFELARMIRSNPLWDGITLIAMTGYGQESDRKKSLAAGFEVHLVKPMDADDIIRVISERRPANNRKPVPS